MRTFWILVCVSVSISGAFGQAPQGPDRVVRLLALLQRRGYEDAAAEELAAMGTSVIPEVVASYRGRDEDEIAPLTMMGPKAIKALLALLEDKELAGAALASMAAIRDPKAIPGLRALIKKTDDPDFRDKLTSCLGDCDPTLDRLSLVALMSDKAPGVRLSAAMALCSSEGGSLDQVLRAMQIFDQSQSERVRRDEVARKLSTYGEPGRRILWKLAQGEDPMAAESLQALCNSPSREEIPLFQHLANLPNGKLRDGALHGLLATQTRQGIETFLSLVGPNDVPGCGLYAVASMAKELGCPEIVRPFILGRLDTDGGAMWSLVMVQPNDPSLVSLIEARIWANDPTTSGSELAALSFLKSPSAARLMEKEFDSASEDQQRQFISSLATIADAGSLPLLERLWRNSSWRAEAMSALGSYRGKEVEQLLTEGLRDTDHKVRVAAVDASRRLGFKDAAAVAAELLNDRATESESDEATIIRALSPFGQPSALPALTRYLERKPARDFFNCVYALDAIREIGGQSAPSIFAKCWKFSAPDRQEVIIASLGVIKGKAALKELRRIADDDTEYFRLRRLARETIARRGSDGLEAARKQPIRGEGS